MATLQLSPIAQINDRFRCGDHTLGQVRTTPCVNSLSSQDQQELFRLLRNFDNFTEENDPHGEHDRARFEFKGEKYSFKIDYFDQSLKYLSEDPSNPKVTTRVLTIMHSSEY